MAIEKRLFGSCFKQLLVALCGLADLRYLYFFFKRILHSLKGKGFNKSSTMIRIDIIGKGEAFHGLLYYIIVLGLCEKNGFEKSKQMQKL